MEARAGIILREAHDLPAAVNLRFPLGITIRTPRCGVMEARAGIEPAIELLQSPALPLGYLAITLNERPRNERAALKAR